jgi:hypothetical protein
MFEETHQSILLGCFCPCEGFVEERDGKPVLEIPATTSLTHSQPPAPCSLHSVFDSSIVLGSRAIDRAVDEHYSKPTGLPLIVAALPEHHHLFHQVSQNSLLIDDGVRTNPDAVSRAELQTLAWQAVEPRYQARMVRLGEEFEQARARGLGSDKPTEVALAAAAGQVATLLLEADRRIDGQLDDETGRVSAMDDPAVGDLLDGLAELVEKKGGPTLVLPAERMPTSTGLAGIYRY